MQETNHSSSGKKLTVERLLELKRLEKPSEEFWTGFERELQQKQLQALVRPSFWERIMVALGSVRSHAAPISAAAIVCVTVGFTAFSVFSTGGRTLEIALYEPEMSPADLALFAEAEAPVASSEAEPAPLPPRTDFVMDVIVQETPSAAPVPFTTYYVVNAFDQVSHQIAAGGGAMEF